jgi:putative membrane protein
MMWGYEYGWGGALAMTLGMLLWFGVLALLIWALMRWITDRTSLSASMRETVSADEFLRQRYARGEIDEATFDRMRDQLQTTSSREGKPMASGR